MKIRKSGKYNNYGPTPRNEYNTTNKKNSTDSISVLKRAMQEDDAMYKQRSPKTRSQYHSSRGWKSLTKVNGWRAELASQQAESMGVRRYYNYVAGEKPTSLNKRKPVNGKKKEVTNGAIELFRFIMEELNLICIYKADTRTETLSNMQAARTYINEPDMLAALDSVANKLDGMTDAAFSGIFFDQTSKEESKAF